MDELDYNGSLKLGHNINIGYFAQNQDEILDEKLTVFQTIDNIATGDIRTKIRGILGAFLFGGDDIDKKVSVLSGGERSRLALIKLLLEPYNLLVLDEPTNHLDMRSKDILKQALLKYDGTLIVVSHDRDFLDGLVDKVYEFRGKKIKENIGGIYEFLKSREREMQQVKKKDAPAGNEGKRTDNKEQYLKRKSKDKKVRKLSREIQNSEEKIERLEKRREELDSILSGEVDSGKQVPENVYEEYEQINSELDIEMKNWEKLSMELEKHS
jgi:ATP-binding cassette subfamily F protein 3